MLNALIAALLTVLPLAGPGTNHAVDDPFTSSRTQWFQDARFGMFIHFGGYSQLEGEYKRSDGSICQDAEWIMNKCKVPTADYERLVKSFNPSSFSAKAIVDTAKAAGQKYIVITSKHHDGYAMWPTKVNKWSLRDHSAFDKKRDVLAELKAESDRQGIKFGLYYSTWDWHDPDARSSNATNFARYKARMRAQLVELIDNYDPALLWFDGDWDTNNPPNPWTKQDGADLEAFLKAKDPELLINNRISKRAPGVKERRVVDGDFGTPEQTFPSAPVEAQLWESCMTIPTKWGYAKWDKNLKSSLTLTRNLVDISSRSGNYLLNVGPDKLGRIPAGESDRLRAMGSWLAQHGDAVYGASASALVADPAWGAVSSKGDKLYLSVYDWSNSLHLKVLEQFDVTKARVLNSPQAVTVTKAGDGYDVKPSGAKTNDVATVIELTIRAEQAAPPGTGTGLAAQYFPNATWSGTPAAARTEKSLNFAWRFDGSPATNIKPDNFSARFTGFVQPRYTDTYTFTTVSDEIAKVWVDGKLVVDASAPHQVRLDKGTISLQAGKKYAIKVEYAEQTGEAFLKLLWSSRNQSQQVVPEQQLYLN